MADQITKLTDVVVPELFTQYVLEQTTEKSELINSGAIENNSQLDKLVSGGGNTLVMPKWDDLTGESQVWSENRDIETDKITTHKEIAALIMRAKGWSSHDMAAALAGDDPMRRIAERVAEWWVRDEKRIVMSILKGVFASSSMADHILDVSGEAGKSNIDAKTVLDAKQLMGDEAEALTMIYMHSAVYTELQKQQLITFKEPANANIRIPTYLGYNVICDDSAPVEFGEGDAKDKFTTYLLSRGCIQRGVGTPVGFVSTETDRDKKKSIEMLYNRQAKVLHPKGMSWIGSANIADETPNNNELATGTNWQRAAVESKQVGMVALVHTLE